MTHLTPYILIIFGILLFGFGVYVINNSMAVKSETTQESHSFTSPDVQEPSKKANYDGVKSSGGSGGMAPSGFERLPSGAYVQTYQMYGIGISPQP